jgi:hypothetical protein
MMSACEHIMPASFAIRQSKTILARYQPLKSPWRSYVWITLPD